MIDKYSKTSLAEFFNYNDPKINEWAENVYEKLRQSGELANYVVRDKRVREFNDVIDNSTVAPIMVKDDRFTFGYAYKGSELDVVDSQVINMGRVWQVEFEIAIDDINRVNDISMFSDHVMIFRTNDIWVDSAIFVSVPFEVGKLHEVKIIRNHNLVSLYLDDVFISETMMDQDIDTEYSVLYKLGNYLPN